MAADIIDLTPRLAASGNTGTSFYSTSHRAEVRPFTPRIALCGRCGSSTHRAHACPLNKTGRDTLKPGE